MAPRLDGIDPRLDKLISAFLDLYPDSEFGPGHIALSDGNLSDSHLLFCLREPRRKGLETDNEDEVVRAFLKMLRVMPLPMRGEC